MTSITLAPPSSSRYSGPVALVVHSLVLAGRILRKTGRNPGVVLDSLLLPVIFLLMFVYLFGASVAGTTEEYLQYIFPGILVMSMLLVGLLSTGININLDVKKGVFDRFRSLPISRAAPLIGLVVGDALRYVVSLVALFGIGLAMGFRPQTDIGSILAACALAILLSFSLSWLTVFIGLVIKETTVVQTVGFLGIFPLAFGTNMAVPTASLPEWLQAWVAINPVSHAVEAARALLVGGPVGASAGITVLWSIVFLLAFVPLALFAYRRRV